MASIDPGLLWVLGVLVTFLTLLVGAIYMSVLRNQDKSDKRADQDRDANERDHDNFWDEINKIKERVNLIDLIHKTSCQKHEDLMADHERRLKEAKDDIYKWRNLLAETKGKLEIRMTSIDNSIRTLTDIAHELKNEKGTNH